MNILVILQALTGVFKALNFPLHLLL